MGQPAAGFERYERIGETITFEVADDATPEPFDARKARARCLPLMDQVAAAAFYEGRDIDDVECERYVEVGDSADGPWRLARIEVAVHEAESAPGRPVSMRSVRVCGTIQLVDRL